LIKKKSLIILVIAVASCLFPSSILFAQSSTSEIPVPTKVQLAWQQAEFGVVFHYDLHVFDGKRYNQTINRITPIADYNIFNPKDLKTDQWIRTAKAAGAKFAILTVTHETGFALYQSDVNPYCLKALKWENGKGNIVRDFVNSCRKYGLKPGLYIGIRWNSFFGVHDFKVQGSDSTFRVNRQHYYNKMVEGMVKELCTRYGPLFEIWFDGGAANPNDDTPNVLPIVEKYQPNCLFYWNAQRADARWGGSETGTVGYPNWATFPFPNTVSKEYPQINANDNYLLKHGDNNGKYWMPAMADAPMRGYNGRHEWFWEPGDDAHIWPLQNLVDMYYQSVGRNATFILGLSPDTSGLIPKADSTRLSAFGNEIKSRFDNPLAEKSGEGNSFIFNFSKEETVNQIVLQEDISKSERVQAYQFLVLKKGKWQPICDGSSIGNKRIQTFKPFTAKEFKLIVTKSKAAPLLRLVSLYNISDTTIRE
jgi:alpha-L-fucosidase